MRRSKIVRYLWRIGERNPQSTGELNTGNIICGTSTVTGILIWQGFLFTTGFCGQATVTGTLTSIQELGGADCGAAATVTGNLTSQGSLDADTLSTCGLSTVTGSMDDVKGFIFTGNIVCGLSDVQGDLTSTFQLTVPALGACGTSTLTGALINASAYQSYFVGVVINDADDDGEQVTAVNYHAASIGKWLFGVNPVLTIAQPSYYRKLNTPSTFASFPKVYGEDIRTEAFRNATLGVTLGHNPALGHKLHYFISKTEYTALEINDIIANMIELTPVLFDGTWSYQSFPFNYPTDGDDFYIYIIHDYRKVLSSLEGVSNGSATVIGRINSIIVQISGTSNGSTEVIVRNTFIDALDPLIGSQLLFSYNPVTLERTELIVPEYGPVYDVAHTTNKLWSTYYNYFGEWKTFIKEWDIVVSPWEAKLNRVLEFSGFYSLSGLQALDDNTLLITSRNGVDPNEIMYETDMSQDPPVRTERFRYPADYVNFFYYAISGDYMITDSPKRKVLSCVYHVFTAQHAIMQHDWETGALEVFIELPSSYNNVWGICSFLGFIYFIEGYVNSRVHRIDPNYPHNINLTDTILSREVYGASQAPDIGAITNFFEIRMLGSSFPKFPYSYLRVQGQWRLGFNTVLRYFGHLNNVNSRITEISLMLVKAGNPDHDLNVSIWSLNGSRLPDQLLESCIEDVPVTSTKSGWFDFKFRGKFYSQDVAIVIEPTNIITNNGSNQLLLWYVDTGSANESIYRDTGAGWQLAAGQELAIKVKDIKACMGTLTNATP